MEGNAVYKDVGHYFRIADDSRLIGDKTFLGINPQELS